MADHAISLINADETGTKTAQIRPKVFLEGAVGLIQFAGQDGRLIVTFSSQPDTMNAVVVQPVSGSRYHLGAISDFPSGFQIGLQALFASGTRFNPGFN